MLAVNSTRDLEVLAKISDLPYTLGFINPEYGVFLMDLFYQLEDREATLAELKGEEC